MRGCVFCADYAQMRMVRMCACAVLRSMCTGAAGASAHVRCCAESRGRAHREKAKNASFSFVFSSGRANPSKNNGFHAPAKEKCAR